MQGLEFVAAIKKRWLYVVVPTVLALAAGVFVTQTAVPMYQATASVYVSLLYGQSANDAFQGSNYAQQQLASYATLAKSPLVLEPVIEELGLDRSPKDLAGSLDVVASSETVVLDVRVSSESPKEAAEIANAVTEHLSVQVKELSPTLESGDSAVNMTTIAEASVPKNPISPDKRRDMIAALLGGVFLGLLAAVARDRLDTRIRDTQDLPRALPSLGAVPFDKSAKRAGPGAGDNGQGVRAEAYRRLRTNLRFVDVDNPLQVVVVTSTLPGEGKSTTAVNLAMVFAEAGERVLLVEADLRRPRVAEYLGMEGSVGLVDVLAGQAALEDVLQPWHNERLVVLPSGTTPPNPSELLGSHTMAVLIKQLRHQFDLVIIDTPPLLPVTDAAVASSVADGVVVVTRYGKVNKHQLDATLDALRTVEARVLGAVLNGVRHGIWSPGGVRSGYRYYHEDRKRPRAHAVSQVALRIAPSQPLPAPRVAPPPRPASPPRAAQPPMRHAPDSRADAIPVPPQPKAPLPRRAEVQAASGSQPRVPRVMSRRSESSASGQQPSGAAPASRRADAPTTSRRGDGAHSTPGQRGTQVVPGRVAPTVAVGAAQPKPQSMPPSVRPAVVEGGSRPHKGAAPERQVRVAERARAENWDDDDADRTRDRKKDASRRGA